MATDRRGLDGDEGEPRREHGGAHHPRDDDATVLDGLTQPLDHDATVLDGLTQPLDHVAAELRELVQEQHAVVPEGSSMYLDNAPRDARSRCGWGVAGPPGVPEAQEGEHQ